MSQVVIRRGFEAKLKAWADAQVPAIPVAWQNVPFTPPAGRYIRAFLLPARTQILALDGIGRTFRGIFQVSFCMPINIGSRTADDLVSALDAEFSATFVQNGLRIYLLEPFSAGPAIQEPDRFVVPCSATYRSDTVA